LLNDGLDLELGRMHDGLLHGALVRDLDEGLVILLGKVRRNIDVEVDLAER